MRRVLGFVLATLGVALLVLGVLSPTVLYPKLATVPLDQQSTSVFDDTARFKLYDNIMDQIAQNGDAVALYSPDKLWAASSKVVGASILPTNKLNFADISLAK